MELGVTSSAAPGSLERARVPDVARNMVSFKGDLARIRGSGGVFRVILRDESAP